MVNKTVKNQNKTKKQAQFEQTKEQHITQIKGTWEEVVLDKKKKVKSK